MTRRTLWPLALVAMEALFVSRYLHYGAMWHFWLHALMGAAAGLTLLTLIALWRRQRVRGAAPWRAVIGGHVFSAMPDILFITVGVLHFWWMDVFAVHISVHFIPAPLLSLYVLLAISVTGWAAVTLGHRRSAAALVAVTVVAAAVLLAFREEPPRTLEGVRDDPQIAWLCPLAVPAT